MQVKKLDIYINFVQWQWCSKDRKSITSFSLHTYAICVDNTGIDYLQGLVYGNKCCLRSKSRKLTGNNALFSVPATTRETYEILATIQLSHFYKEIGNYEKAIFGSYIVKLDDFKNTINNSSPSTAWAPYILSPECLPAFPSHCIKICWASENWIEYI